MRSAGGISLIDLIKAECLKLKGTPYWKILPFIGILLPLTGTIINANSWKQGTWESFVDQNLWLAVMLIWPSFILVLGSHMFLCEKKQNTIENLLVIPVNRVGMICSKLIILLFYTELLSVHTYMANLMILLLGISLSGQEFLNGLFLYMGASAGMFAALLSCAFYYAQV